MHHICNKIENANHIEQDDEPIILEEEYQPRELVPDPLAMAGIKIADAIDFTDGNDGPKIFIPNRVNPEYCNSMDNFIQDFENAQKKDDNDD